MLTDSIVNRLDAGVADGGMAIGDSRELREKRGRKLDDGAVLHEHSLVTAEVQGGEFPRLDVLIDLEGNHMAEKRFEKILEGFVEPEGDGLARGI